jgi:hypothetical protein
MLDQKKALLQDSIQELEERKQELWNPDGTSNAPSAFPRKVRNSRGEVATVKNAAELADAQAEGFN